MSLSDRLGAALARLSGALDHLESAAERRAEADAGRADSDLEFTLLQDDRSRLASELDAALTRAAALLAANNQVSARLAHTGSTVQAVLAHYESAEQEDLPGHAAPPSPGAPASAPASDDVPVTQTTITLSIAGRVYRMACEPGEEDHLRRLGRRLEAKIDELRQSFGEIGDQRITVMAALTLADQLVEAEQRVAQLETDVSRLKASQASAGAAVEAVESAVATAIEEAATRIDGVARSMLAGVRP